jgi:hypothetical protein
MILDSPKYRNLGYIWGSKTYQSCNWLQYADDAALIAKDQKSAQGLTNLFDAWCFWADMCIRIDKCCSFGMVKKDTSQIQVLPNISITSGNIPSVKLGDSFTYLGKIFNFEMNDTLAKTVIITKLDKFLQITSNLHIKPQTKLKILDRFIPSQISFNLKIYNLAGTWITENIDALCIRHIRRWLEAPISSCISEWLIMPSTKCGMGIPSFKNRFDRIVLSKRAALKNSKNENIKELWHETSYKNVNSDSLLITEPTLKIAKTVLIKKQEEEAANHFFGLEFQNNSIKCITENIPSKVVADWSATVNSLPGYLFNFVRKSIQGQMPTLSNLFKWGKSTSPSCPLCSQIQTNKHVFSNCASSVALSRYTQRHDSILEAIANWFANKIPLHCKMFVDLPHLKFHQCVDLFVGLRPDLAFVMNDKLYVLELTICHETNILNSKNYKLNKYKNLCNHKSERYKNLSVVLSTCEISVLGLTAIDPKFLSALGVKECDNSFRKSLTKLAIMQTADIYVKRNT